MDIPGTGTPIDDVGIVHIPVEIVDKILDYLRSDEHCLRKCALVSKPWNHRCRRHLFARVSFEGPWDFLGWSDSISAALPNGPHIYTRELTISNSYLDGDLYRSATFFRHLPLFRNVQKLAIKSFRSGRTIDNISVPNVFGHLFGTLLSLSIRGIFCSPQALISMIASFRRLEALDLYGIQFEAPKRPRALPERCTFKGTLSLVDWDDLSEEFVVILAQYDVRYRQMTVNGMWWLQDTAQNRFLAKCADHLEEFKIDWLHTRSESACCQFWMGSLCSLPFQGFHPTHLRALTFRNLRTLSMRSSRDLRTILPPPEFFTSIESTNLSGIIIDMSLFLLEELDGALDAIRDYDEAFYQLANQLDPSSSGSGKLVLTLRLMGGLADLAAILPRFSNSGIFKIEAK